MLTLEDYMMSNGFGNTMFLLRKADVQPNIANDVYEAYRVAFSMAKTWTNADDETLIDDLVSYCCISPLTANIFQNSFIGAKSESTTNSGITTNFSYDGTMLDPYKQFLSQFKRAKFL